MSQTKSDPFAVRQEKLDETWKDIESRLDSFEAEKQAFEREFGFSFQQYLDYCISETKTAEAAMSPKELEDLQYKRDQIAREFDAELALAASQAKATGKKSSRSRRMRNRV